MRSSVRFTATRECGHDPQPVCSWACLLSRSRRNRWLPRTSRRTSRPSARGRGHPPAHVRLAFWRRVHGYGAGRAGEHLALAVLSDPKNGLALGVDGAGRRRWAVEAAGGRGRQREGRRGAGAVSPSTTAAAPGPRKRLTRSAQGNEPGAAGTWPSPLRIADDDVRFEFFYGILRARNGKERNDAIAGVSFASQSRTAS